MGFKSGIYSKGSEFSLKIDLFIFLSLQYSKSL